MALGGRCPSPLVPGWPLVGAARCRLPPDALRRRGFWTLRPRWGPLCAESAPGPAVPPGKGGVAHHAARHRPPLWQSMSPSSSLARACAHACGASGGWQRLTLLVMVVRGSSVAAEELRGECVRPVPSPAGAEGSTSDPGPDRGSVHILKKRASCACFSAGHMPHF